MTVKKIVLSLMLLLAACLPVTALADAADEAFWSYAYAVDRTISVNASDGLGLFMREGPDTSYPKINRQTIPNGTELYISYECVAENGWKWGWCSYFFPGDSYESSGWICLVETTTRTNSSSQNAETSARAVDRVLYISTADGLGLYMRGGPGTNYDKVNSRTIPNGTAIHVTQEITASNGWNWGWCSYQFPGRSGPDSGWVCLVETTTQAPTSTAPPAGDTADASTEPRAVDRVLYISTADGLGLYMRIGPGTEYDKVNSRTIPNGTAIHVTQEITASNGWNWGWCSYQFPGRSSQDSGWVCLVETTTQAPSVQVSGESQMIASSGTVFPADSVPAHGGSASKDKVGGVPGTGGSTGSAETAGSAGTKDNTTDSTETVTTAETTDSTETSGEVQESDKASSLLPSSYNNLSLVLIGIIVGVLALGAVLMILARRR